MYPVMKVEQRHRFSSSFSDFITRYTAVSSTNKQTQIAEYYALDPGDVLTFAGGQADEGWITCITSIRQKIGGKQSLKCVGKNPRLAQAKSRNDKNISGLLNQIEDNAKTGKIGIHTFTNASAHEIGQTKVKLISIQFASSEENHMQVFCTDCCGCGCGSCGTVCRGIRDCGASVSGWKRQWNWILKRTYCIPSPLGLPV